MYWKGYTELQCVFAAKTNADGGQCEECETHMLNFTFADPVQPLPLHFVFVSQGHGVKHNTAQDSTARHGRAPLLLSHKYWQRFTLLVHCQHYSPGHTASAHTPARKAQTQKNVVKQHWDTHTHTQYINTLLMYKHKKTLWQGKALKSPWLQSHSASCSHRAWEAAGDRYREKSENHTHTVTQILLVTKCPIWSKKWQRFNALKAPLFCCLKSVFFHWQTLIWRSI